MPEFAPTVVAALGTTLLHFLWQGTLVGIAAWAALLLLRNARPQARYLVACLALLACVLLPAWTLLQALPDDAVASALPVAPLVAADAAMPATALPTPLAAIAGEDAARLPWLVLAWAAGAAALGLRMLLGLAWVQALRRHAQLEVDAGLQARLDALARRFGLRRTVALQLLDGGETPFAIGWWKPAVLLPAAIAARMPLPLLEALLAHELAHIRRHDYLVNLLQGVVEALLFYHPVVWWLSHRIRIEREQVADRLAADVLDDPRRIALALATLDCLAAASPAAPTPALAQAAHGGQLMHRIQQLIRPEHRLVGGTFALPLVGIVAMGIAFQAYAQLGPEVRVTTTDAVAAPPAPPAPPAAVDAPSPPAPPIAPAATDAPAPPAPPAPPSPAVAPPPPPPTPPPAHRGKGDGNGYALVRAGQQGFAMSGSSDDIATVRRLRQDIDGDFLWVRRDGQGYVVRDAGVLAKVRAAWQPVDALDARMQALQQRMEPHQRELDALQSRMDRIAAPTDSPEMRAAEAAMQDLANRQESLAAKQSRLAARMARSDDAGRDALHREMDALSREMDTLARQMDGHAAVMERQSEAMQHEAARMDAVGREMEAAARPMQAIGRDMEALSGQIEREAGIAEKQVHALIDDAMRRGLATPVPALR